MKENIELKLFSMQCPCQSITPQTEQPPKSELPSHSSLFEVLVKSFLPSFWIKISSFEAISSIVLIINYTAIKLIFLILSGQRAYEKRMKSMMK